MEKRLTPEEQRVIEAIKKTKKAELKKIGQRIGDFREAMGYTQQNLASDISKRNIIPDIDNFSEKIISRHETGNSEMGIITFINYCRALHVTPNELLADFFQDDETLMPEITQMYKRLDEGNQRALLKYYDLLYYRQSGGEQYGKF